jgi:hypothetical protein
VDVTASDAGDYANDIPAGELQTSAGTNAGPADAILHVALVPPTVTKSFAPASVAAGASSTLTITLGNGNAVPSSLTAALVDAFPAGLEVAATPNAQTTCGGTLTATPAADSVTLDGAAVIAPTGTCTITVDVVSAIPGSYANDIPAGALQTDSGTNAAPADATLDVTP